MDIRKLQRTIVDALEDVKAQDIEVFNTEELTSLFDRVIVASGTSNRQTRALASSVRDSVKAAGFEVRNPEGEETGEWVLVDCGAAVVHIMQPAIRAYYKLEELWGAKPVHLKLGGAKRVGAKVAAKGPDSRPDKPEDETKVPARKTAASKTAARKRPAAKKAAATTAPTRTSPYGETSAEKKRVTRVVGTAAGARSAPAAPARKRAQAAEVPTAAKRPAARKTASAKVAAAKRPAAKTPGAKPPAKRVAAKKRAS
ncbi:ribosome silencing factor [Thiomonas intermedia]|uniref:ribosome silencing factor n=1 Tax=Thiomonas intermedia TaxID=926 RepID=UPI0009A4998D|nr:ribosome silencing factor [Thiomonas intermedia]